MAEHYRDLDVWKISMDLAVEVHKLLKLLPKEETYALSDQMRRSSTSIPTNIAEGYERNNVKEFVYFLRIARGSRAELQTQIFLCENFEYLTREQTAYALQLTDLIGKKLYWLINHLQNKSNTNT